jgi:hypothetical protein
MLTRLLPGSVVAVAAFTMPEFSVGAGDLVDRGGFDDPPEPAFKQARIKGAGPMKIGQASVCRFPLRFDPGFSSRSDPGCW